METDATRMCRLLVGLRSVNVLGVVDLLPAVPLVVHVETARLDPEACDSCGVDARLKDRDPVVLIDLPCFGRRTRLLWRKRRWRCPSPTCTRATWTETDPSIGHHGCG